MFKKKIDLSALINKTEQENNVTSNDEIITSSFDEENKNTPEVVVENTENNKIETKEEEKTKIEIKPSKKIWIKKNNVTENTIIKEETQNKLEEIIKVEKKEESTPNEEIKYNYTTTVETNDLNTTPEIIIDEVEEKKDKKKKKDDKNKVETPEELEKRYEEMTSKIEIKKEEVEYNKEENNDLFWNYKSDFEIKSMEKKTKIEEKIQDELWREKESPMEEKKVEPEILNENKNVQNEKIDNVNLEEKIIIKPKNNKKLIKILILLLIISIIWSTSYFFNDIKKLIIKDNIATNTWAIEDTNSGIIDSIDPEIKDEVNDYIEQIKKDDTELTPIEIKKKINDKIIEIYLKRAMTK